MRMMLRRRGHPRRVSRVRALVSVLFCCEVDALQLCVRGRTILQTLIHFRHQEQSSSKSLADQALVQQVRFQHRVSTAVLWVVTKFSGEENRTCEYNILGVKTSETLQSVILLGSPAATAPAWQQTCKASKPSSQRLTTKTCAASVLLFLLYCPVTTLEPEAW